MSSKTEKRLDYVEGHILTLSSLIDETRGNVFGIGENCGLSRIDNNHELIGECLKRMLTIAQQVNALATFLGIEFAERQMPDNPVYCRKIEPPKSKSRKKK
jgi:hypothetical protein